MKKLEYKFVKLPKIARKNVFLNTISTINDIRIPKLDSIFNELSNEGFILVEIYWSEVLALFKKEIL